jgi:hypothetical protein
MLYHGQVTQKCEVCGKDYRPRTTDQRFCGDECRRKKKASEQRVARKLWRDAGRPSEAELEA